MANNDVVKMITQPARAVFPHLVDTESFQGQDTGKYAVTLEFSPEAVADIEEAVASINSKGGTSPLKKIPEDAEYGPGNYRIKAKSRFKVKVLDKNKEAVDPGTISNGDEVRASIGLAAYKTGANHGVTVYLNGIQLLSGGSAGSDLDFGALPEGYGEAEDLPF